MRPDEYVRYDATDLAELVRHREVSADELLAVARQCLEARNPTLNAVIRTFNPDAPATGPFVGVPFLLKDTAQSYAGQPLTQGSRAFRSVRANTHSSFVRRCEEAGLQCFGYTNVPELALKAITEPDAYGPTRNPWNPERTPGGSSGGAAAAVAAGIVPMAGANDGGGSIRIPAAYCGLFGLRPSRGRVPSGPDHGEIWEGASSDHVLTRSVRDSAAMLDALSGPDEGAPFHIAPPERPFIEEIHREPGRLRIGFSVRSPLGTAVSLENRRAVESTVRHLEALGHHVEETEPDIDGMEVARCYITMYLGQVAATVAQANERDFELDTRALAILGRALHSGDYVASHRRWNHFARRLAAFFTRHDLYLTPTTAMPPARIGELDTPLWLQHALRTLLALRAGRLLMKTGLVETLARKSLERTPFTQLANLCGVPAMSVPLHWGEDGLPYGSHFVAPFGQEARLLRVAAQLEQAHPWRERVPSGTSL